MLKRSVAIVTLVLLTLAVPASPLAQNCTDEYCEDYRQVVAAQIRNQLVGTYRLISYKRTVVATGVTTDIFGTVPQGYIIYGRDGRMMVLAVRDERHKPSALATFTNQERADLYNTMLAYSGTYDFDGKTVTHHIDVSWDQIWAGTHQPRNVRFDGRKVIITNDAHPHSLDGKMSVAVLTFEKVD